MCSETPKPPTCTGVPQASTVHSEVEMLRGMIARKDQQIEVLKKGSISALSTIKDSSCPVQLGERPTGRILVGHWFTGSQWICRVSYSSEYVSGSD